MSKSEFGEIINYIKQNFTDDATDISDALELLNLAFDGLLNSANDRIAVLSREKDYDKTSEIIEFLKSVSALQDQIIEYSNIFSEGLETDEEEPNEELIEESGAIGEQGTIPNYAAYVVDSFAPHTLYEDFTHKKATAFSINNTRYDAKDWKDVLLKTCNVLAEIDESKFYDFLDDPVFRGRKISYFSREYVETKNVKLENLDLYVWVNLSANGVKKLISKLLKRYNIKISNYYIYLRADYTPLHNTYDVKNNSINTNSNDEEKIGIYVRNTLRQLSKKTYFSKSALSDMQSKQWSKETLSLNYPLLREYIDGIDISQQIRDDSYGRYWKEIFEFSGKKYFVTSQWYERQRELFNKWIKRI